MAQQRYNRRFRRGMTLVELLMVVATMTLLMAIAIPMVRPAFQNRQLREAARQTNAFFAGAMARAGETGRPVGVWIEASGVPGDPQYATRLYLAEVAPASPAPLWGRGRRSSFPLHPPRPRVRIHPGRMNLTTNRWENSASGIPAEPLRTRPTTFTCKDWSARESRESRVSSSSFALITRDRCIPV